MRKLIPLLLFIVGCLTSAQAQFPITVTIVAKTKLLSQTGPVSSEVVFTPTNSGTYRITVYGSESASASNVVNINVSYTDSFALKLITDGISPGNDHTLTFISHLAASQPVSLEINSTTGDTYDAEVIVEKM